MPSPPRTAAVLAAVCHRHTNYDKLLGSGIDRKRAREQVAERIQSIPETSRESA